MSYTTAKLDWEADDYFNVADWTRIYNNAALVITLADIMTAANPHFPWTAIPTPTTTTIAGVDSINTLLGNVETMRAEVAVLPISGAQTEIKDDWIAGVGQAAPNYTDTNLWEGTIDAVWSYFGGPSLLVCPTLTADLTIADTTIVVIVDCIDTDTFDIIIEGSGALYII